MFLNQLTQNSISKSLPICICLFTLYYINHFVEASIPELSRHPQEFSAFHYSFTEMPHDIESMGSGSDYVVTPNLPYITVNLTNTD